MQQELSNRFNLLGVELEWLDDLAETLWSYNLDVRYLSDCGTYFCLTDIETLVSELRKCLNMRTDNCNQNCKEKLTLMLHDITEGKYKGCIQLYYNAGCTNHGIYPLGNIISAHI